MKRRCLCLSIICFLVLGTASAFGASSKIPPFITRVVTPNVLIILDHSGSMLGTDVPGWKDRWTATKTVIMQLLQDSGELRWGLMRLDGSDKYGNQSAWSWTNPPGNKSYYTNEDFVRHGGKLLCPVGTDVDDLVAYIGGMEIYDTVPHTYTVNSETLFTATQYFAGGHGPAGLGQYKEENDPQVNYQYRRGGSKYWARDTDDYGNPINNSSPIEFWCQQNFIIYLTDGESNCDSDWKRLTDFVGDYDGDGADDPNAPEWDESGGNHYLDDVAKWMYENDLRLDMPGDQNVITYVVGLKIDAPLLQRTADENHGRGMYFTANDYDQLKAAFDEIVSDIIRRTASGTSVAILSSSSSVESRLFRAKFHPKYWRGFLEAFKLPYHKGDEPLWDAGYVLKDNTNPDNRNIFTALDSASGDSRKIDKKVEFTTGNINVQDADGFRLKTHLGDDAEAERIIQFIRGEDSPPDTRTREGYKLGDIIFSNPVVSGDTIYVGANDGMLHAFDIDTGMEKWAFIPNNLLGKLKELCSPDYYHEYFVDLKPVIANISINGVRKKVLLGGERAGGKAYFCLDITDSSASGFKPLWEFMDPDLGESWSVPDIKPIKMDGQNKWVAFFGSGFENADQKGYGFVVDIETGEVLSKGRIDTQGNWPKPNAITSPRAIDTDGDDCVDRAYVGTIDESLTRVDLTGLPNTWKTKWIFTTRPNQPITIPTSLSYYYEEDGSYRRDRVMVFFGTGKFYDLEDKEPPFDLQSFYAIKDEGEEFTVGIGQLVDQTDPCNETEGTFGWYIDFTANEGERVVSSALVIGGYVFFTTFQPSDDPCEAGGIARLWCCEYDTGCAPDHPVVDINGDGEVNDTDMVNGTVPRSNEIGYGVPSDIIFNPEEETIIIQTSDATIHQFKVDVNRDRVRVRSWREVID